MARHCIKCYIHFNHTEVYSQGSTKILLINEEVHITGHISMETALYGPGAVFTRKIKNMA